MASHRLGRYLAGPCLRKSQTGLATLRGRYEGAAIDNYAGLMRCTGTWDRASPGYLAAGQPQQRPGRKTAPTDRVSIDHVCGRADVRQTPKPKACGCTTVRHGISRSTTRKERSRNSFTEEPPTSKPPGESTTQTDSYAERATVAETVTETPARGQHAKWVYGCSTSRTSAQHAIATNHADPAGRSGALLSRPEAVCPDSGNGRAGKDKTHEISTKRYERWGIYHEPACRCSEGRGQRLRRGSSAAYE